MGIILTVALVVISAGEQGVCSEESMPTGPTDAYSFEDDMARNPLKPPDTTSPRATLQSFLENMNRAYRVLMAAHDKNKKTPGLFTSQSVRDMVRRADELFGRGVYSLDLSGVPKALKEELGDERALELKEILDRIELPPFEEIPDAEAIEKAGEQEEKAEWVHWRIPNTDIVIAKVEEGARKGEYLFAPQTVARLGEFYKKVKHLPYRSDTFTSDGFLDFYIGTPGRLLPPKWNQWLPGWTTHVYLGQTLWQWGALAVSLILIFWSNIALFRRLQFRAGELSPAKRHLGWGLFVLFAGGTITFLYFFGKQINITGSVLTLSRMILGPVFWFLLATGAFFLGQTISESIIASPKIDPKGIQASYLRAVFGLVGFLASAAIIVYGLSRIGISLIPLITGLGIGGLALALAARPTIENIISGFMIFADKPFRVGQRIVAMGEDGIVESIGLRSTKIRLFTGSQISIPNEKMAAVEIENVARRPYIRRRFNVTIPYDTPPEKINRAVEILREILAVPEAADLETTNATGESAATGPSGNEAEKEPHPNEAINQPKRPPRVFFNDLNADSLNIMVLYWYVPPKYWNYLKHAQWINMQIIERFKAEGIDFAIPAQRLHLADDDTRPLTIGQRGILKEGAFTDGAVLGQEATLDAQAAQSTPMPEGESVPSQANEAGLSKPKAVGQPADARVKDEWSQDPHEGEAEDKRRPQC
jgi:MscS family membrane protein